MTSSVFAPYWLDMVSSTPGSPWISVSPYFGSGPSFTVATSFNRTAVPFVVEAMTTAWPRTSGESDWPSVCSETRWFSVSMNPAPITPVETRAAFSTSVRDRL